MEEDEEDELTIGEDDDDDEIEEDDDDDEDLRDVTEYLAGNIKADVNPVEMKTVRY